MSSESRTESPRADGANFREAVTPDINAPMPKNAPANAAAHGFLAGKIVLPRENPELFESILRELIAELRPETPIEARLVEIMAVADWRRARSWFLESAEYTHTINEQQQSGPGLTEEDAKNPGMRAALAFKTLNDSSTVLQNLNRYEVRYSREYNQALSLFLQHRSRRLKEDSRRRRKYPQT